MTTTTTTTAPTFPAWIDLDKLFTPELRAEVARIIDELNAIEPQLESLGRRAYEVHQRMDRAERAAVDALEAIPGVHRVDIVDGASDLLSALSGSSKLWDTAIRIGGHLHAWTDCRATDPAWLVEARSTNGQEGDDD